MMFIAGQSPSQRLKTVAQADDDLRVHALPYKSGDTKLMFGFSSEANLMRCADRT